MTKSQVPVTHYLGNSLNTAAQELVRDKNYRPKMKTRSMSLPKCRPKRIEVEIEWPPFYTRVSQIQLLNQD